MKPNSVVYIGKIDAVIRKRKNDSEVRAGELWHTYIGQALAGFSTGTFDIEFKDNYDEDMKLYLAEYPGLQKVKIEKSILSAWKRPAVPSARFFRSQILGL